MSSSSEDIDLITIQRKPDGRYRVMYTCIDETSGRATVADISAAVKQAEFFVKLAASAAEPMTDKLLKSIKNAREVTKR